VLKQEADVAASRRAATVEAAKQDEKDAIRADEQAVVAAAEAKSGDAAAKRAEAATKRAQADRIEELADNEKAKRQADRAGNNGS
jgi:hypothetical protein